MKMFRLYRRVDMTGISGTGVVAEGVEFSNGKCVLAWVTGVVDSIAIYDSIEDIRKIHGHSGATSVVWND